MAEKITTSSAQETQSLASDLVKELKTGMLVALKGDLGAGKTTFVQGLGEVLDIGRMLSPTYTLIREYPVDQKKWPFERLYHIDLYRLASSQEAMDLGLNEIWFNPKNLILVEWPEKIIEFLPTPHIMVEIEKGKGDEREISITK